MIIAAKLTNLILLLLPGFCRSSRLEPSDKSPPKESRSPNDLRVAITLDRFEVRPILGYDRRSPSPGANCDQDVERHVLRCTHRKPSQFTLAGSSSTLR